MNKLWLVFSVALLCSASPAISPPGVFRESLQPSAGGLSPSASAGGSSGVVAPTITITVPSADPEPASGTNEIVSGTTTNTPDTVTWSTTAVPGPTSCSVGAGTFSCTVTQTQDGSTSQTVTVTATNAGGSATDTTGLVFPSFDLQPGSTGPNDLPDALTVNGTSMTLVLACDAEDISGTSWTCRDGNGNVVLSEAGAGSSPTTTTATPFHAFDSAERGVTTTSGQKYFEAASSTPADVATDDLLVAWVAKHAYDGAGSNDYVVAKRDASNEGFGCVASSATAFLCVLEDDDNTQVTATGPSITTGAIYAGTFFVDRNENSAANGGIVYVNGVAGTGANFSTTNLTLANPAKLSIASQNGTAGTTMAAAIYSLRIWSCAGCYPGGASNPTTWAPVARELTSIAFGMAPTLAAGDDAPASTTRATTAVVDVVDGSERLLYTLGQHAPRVSRRFDGATVQAGYLSEPGLANLVRQSETLGTTWAVLEALTTVTANAKVAPDGTTTGDGIECAPGGPAVCALRQNVVLSATTHSFSAWAAAGDTDDVALRNNTIANGMAFFNLTTCAACTIGDSCPGAVGTTGAGVLSATAERYVVGAQEWCRVGITFTGTVAGHDVDLICAEADNDITWPSDANTTDNCSFWGVSVGATDLQMLSYTPTTTAAVTRDGDEVEWDGAGGNYTGSPTTYDTAFFCPQTSNLVSGSQYMVFIGADSNNYMRHLPRDTNVMDSAGLVGGVLQWFKAGPTDVADGAAHSMRTTAVTNNVNSFYDSTIIGAADTSASLPATASSKIGFTDPAGASGAGCIITRYRLWPDDVTPTEAP